MRLDTKCRSFAIVDLFYAPSFYGFLAWTFGLMFYSTKIISVVNLSLDVAILFFMIIVCFLCSSIIFAKLFSNFKRRVNVGFLPRYYLLVMFHALGFLGVIIYFKDFSLGIGGYGEFYGALLNDSSSIRTLAESMTSIGFQVSYFGWFAIFGSAYYFFKVKNLKKYFLLVLMLIQLVSNIIFIDRTRPIWLLFSVAMAWLIAQNNPRLSKIMLYMSSLLMFIVGVFILVAYWTGKLFSGVGVVAEIYLYASAGFAYFQVLTQQVLSFEYIPVRALYPLFKVLYSVGIYTVPVPEQILPYLEVPYSVNVGTFLEPLYSDGGWIYTILGSFLLIFFIDFIALCCLRFGYIFGFFFWAVLCFSWFISFFVPKFVSLPVWIFFLLFLIEFFLFKFLGLYSVQRRKS